MVFDTKLMASDSCVLVTKPTLPLCRFAATAIGVGWMRRVGWRAVGLRE
jgi:hypothetical protein